MDLEEFLETKGLEQYVALVEDIGTKGMALMLSLSRGEERDVIMLASNNQTGSRGRTKRSLAELQRAFGVQGYEEEISGSDSGSSSEEEWSDEGDDEADDDGAADDANENIPVREAKPIDGRPSAALVKPKPLRLHRRARHHRRRRGPKGKNLEVLVGIQEADGEEGDEGDWEEGDEGEQDEGEQEEAELAPKEERLRVVRKNLPLLRFLVDRFLKDSHGWL